MFCDVVGSTELGERLDPESVRRIITRYFEVSREVLTRHGGTVEKFIGDAVMAAFGTPQIHEDDALRAVRAAQDLHDALSDLNEQLERGHGVRIETRVGIETGEVLAGDAASGEGFVTGDPVNVAARLEQAAAPGEVLIGPVTHGLVRDAVEVQLVPPLSVKGKSEPLVAYQLLRVHSWAPGHARRFDTPMVGREDELSGLELAFDGTIADSACRMTLVLGPAGIGKTRLVREFAARIGDRGRVLSGRCLPYGDGITYWALAGCIGELIEGEATSGNVARRIRAVLGSTPDAETVSQRAAQAIGVAAGGAAPQETFWALRRFLETIALDRPVVLILDDLQWAETTFLDLLQYLVDRSRVAPILLVGVARTELLEARPGWAGVDPAVISVILDPLTADQSASLAANFLGGVVDHEVLDHLVDITEGSPLFAEEYLSSLEERGLLQERDGVWAAGEELSSIPVPLSIQTLLAARLATIAPPECAVLERAAVVGETFYWGAVDAMTPDVDRALVGTHLMNLSRKYLIRPARSDLPGEDAYRFRHILLRDAAYEEIPKATRAQLHERFAGWLTDRTSQIGGYDEIVGYHLERSYQNLADLGPLDERGVRIGERAADLLCAAADRAGDRGDDRVARGLLERAVALVPSDERKRAQLLLGLYEYQDGDPSHEQRLAAEAVTIAQRLGDRAMQALAHLYWLDASQLVKPRDVRMSQVRAAAEEAVAALDDAGDERELVLALVYLGLSLERIGRYRAERETLQRAIEVGERAGLRRELSYALFMLVGAFVLDSTPVEEAIASCRALLQQRADDLAFRCAVLWRIGYLEAWAGRSDEARELTAQASNLAEELGFRSQLSNMALFAADLEFFAGDLVEAERRYRDRLDTVSATGDAWERAWVSARLARVLVDQGRYEDAYPLTVVAEAEAVIDESWTGILWRAARAAVLARRGDRDASEALAREAVQLAFATESPQFQGDALRGLADVLFVAGRTDEAEEALKQAIARYEDKGIVVLADRARTLLRETAAS